MKRNILMSSICAAALAAVFSASAGAQTCAAPFVWQTDLAGNDPVSDTTCGHETSLTGLCQATGAPGEAYIAQITVAAEGTFTAINFTGGAGYTIATGLVPVSSGCGDQPCTTVGDGTTAILHADIPPGQYYLIVTGADFDAPGSCGTFTMTTNGTLPVEVQNFTVS
jgi:hypothetical protein